MEKKITKLIMLKKLILEETTETITEEEITALLKCMMKLY